MGNRGRGLRDGLLGRGRGFWAYIKWTRGCRCRGSGGWGGGGRIRRIGVFLGWNLIKRDLDIVDENVGVVDGGRKMVGGHHVTIGDELDMMGAGR